jgi:hypothetical protein
MEMAGEMAPFCLGTLVTREVWGVFWKLKFSGKNFKGTGDVLALF